MPEDASDGQLREARAGFLAGRGWSDPETALASLEERDAALATARGEVTLWFEPDLYDQLQLLQILDRLSRPDLAGVRLTAVEPVERMGSLSEEDARERFAGRAPVAAAVLALGARVWAALRAPDPRGLEALAEEPAATALPFLAPALRRHLEELPAVGDGLSRSERQALAALAEGPRRAADAFRAAHHEREERVFLGDLVFWSYLDRLAAGERPLVRLDPGPCGPRTVATLTADGREVLAGRLDWIALGGSDRWLGGVRLSGTEDRWRWDPAAGRVRVGATRS